MAWTPRTWVSLVIAILTILKVGHTNFKALQLGYEHLATLSLEEIQAELMLWLIYFQPSRLVFMLGLNICCTGGFLCYVLFGGGVSLEMHGYQMDYLTTLATSLPSNFMTKASPSDALTMLVERALNEPQIMSAVFDSFHCNHCGSPAPWIKERKGKTPQSFHLSRKVRRFLAEPLLLRVEKVGNPPVRKAIYDAPRIADMDKAARCCVDWAIKHYGPLNTTPKPEAQKKSD